MKRNTLLTVASVLLVCLLAVSCNLDAGQGIFREVSVSVQSVGISIIGSAGFDRATSTAYYVSDEGLQSKRASEDPQMILADTAAIQIKQAFVYTEAAVTKAAIIAQSGDTIDSPAVYYTYEFGSQAPVETSTLAIDLSYGFLTSWTDNSKNSLTVSYLGSAGSVAINDVSAVRQIIGTLDLRSDPGEAHLLITYWNAASENRMALVSYTGGTLQLYNLTSPDSYNIAGFSRSGDSLVLVDRNKGYVYYISDINASTAAVNSQTRLSDTFPATASVMYFYGAVDGANIYILKGYKAYTTLSWDIAGGSFSSTTTTSGFANGLIVTTVGAIRIAQDSALVYTAEGGLFTIDTLNGQNSAF